MQPATKHTLIITSFGNSRSKMIIARQLAHDPAISLQKALSIVEKPPFVLMRNISSQELKYLCDQLSNMGIHFQVVETESTEIKKDQTIPTTVSDADYNIQPPQPMPVPPKVDIQQKPVTSYRTIFPIPVSSEPIKTPLKLQYFISGMVVLILTILTISGLLLSSRRPHFILKKTGKALISSGDDYKAEMKNTNQKKKKAAGRTRDEISMQAKKEASMWVDSATAYRNDLLKAINFYKIAISFNRYNIHAWFGLLNTYRSLQMNSKAVQTRNEMFKLFGKNIFSISEAVEDFGEIIDAYETEDDVYRLEYKTTQKTENDLLSETYKLVKVLREICKCNSLSIFATTAPGRGMIVHLPSNAKIVTPHDFKTNAAINFLD